MHYQKRLPVKSIGIAAMMLFNLSCGDHAPQPDQEPFVGSAPQERLLIATTDKNSVTTSIEYDAEKRPVKYTNKNEAINMEYTTDLVKHTNFLSNGNKSAEILYEMKNGLVSKRTVNHYEGKDHITSVYSTSYEYSNGKLIVERSVLDGEFVSKRESHYYSDGNLDYWQDYDIDNKIIRKISFTYYTDLADKSGAFGQFTPTGTGNLYPKMSKFLIKSQTWEENNGSERFDYSYDLDSEKYIIKAVVAKNGNLISSWTNVWQ